MRTNVAVHEGFAAGEADLPGRKGKVGDFVEVGFDVGGGEVDEGVVGGGALDVAGGAGDVAEGAGVEPEGAQGFEGDVGAGGAGGG